MTWKPDPGNPSLNQPLTFVGRQVASANGAVEIWELANPTPGVAGAALSHTLSANAKRVMGVHALAGVGGHGTPVGAGANSNAISVNVPSQTGALVLDVIFGSNSTTAHTAGAGQTEHWDLNTTGGTNNLRGAGSSEAGAATTTMSWTSGSVTHHALLAVSYNPAIPSEPPPPTAPGAPNLTAATAGNGSVALTWTAPASDGGSPISGYEIWRGTTSGGESLLTTVGVTTDLHRLHRQQRHDLLLPGRRGQRRRPRSGLQRAQRHAAPPPPPTAPGAPNLTAASAGNASVALTWTAPASDGGSPISGYEIWRGTTSGGESLLTTVGVTHDLHRLHRQQRHDLLLPGRRGQRRRHRPGLQRAQRHADRAGAGHPARRHGQHLRLAQQRRLDELQPAGRHRPPGGHGQRLQPPPTTVTSMTWKPDPGNPALNQPLTFVGRQVASANGAVEIWELANPTPGVAGAALSHTLSANAKRVMGVHALAGVGGHGTPVGAGSNSTAIWSTCPRRPAPSCSTSSSARTAPPPTPPAPDRPSTGTSNTTGGTNNLRGAGSSEAGAATTTMSWTSGAVTHHALLAVSYNPH